MDGFWMEWGRRVKGLGLGATACVLLGSCAGFDKSWVPGSAASLAQDQIMLVRKEPPSFGFHRLETQSRIYPDLGLFVKQRGQPDFLAETGDHERHYFILYYLRERKAFACRTRPRHAGTVEFSGPYPITAGEYRLLDGFRRGKPH
jgi:hypothetical protein